MRRLLDRLTPPATIASFMALAVGAGGAAGQDDLNIGRYRFVTGSSSVGDALPAYATDGKIGPANRWVTSNRGRHRLNIFFDRDTAVGGVHLYSGGNGDPVVQDFSVQYRNAGGSLVDVPGASVASNAARVATVHFASPVTTQQIQISIDDLTAFVQEVAVFPPTASPVEPGRGVSLHLARQHRLPLTTASSTAAGSSRRAVVDGFVNDNDFWQSNGTANQWITLDMTDPAETNPVSVRAVTSPVEIGSVHLYTGTEAGEPPVSRGRLQMPDPVTGVWTDIAGGSFNNNTERSLAVVFDQPVTTASLRLVLQAGGSIVREIVPLPPGDGQGWPLGQSVVFGAATDYLAYGDKYYGITLAGSGLSLTSAAGDASVLRPQGAMLTQHHQVLLNVGTDTYRIRNRITGRCLEPAGGSFDVGAAVVETVYTALPTQRWRIEAAAGGIRFVNSATGLAIAATDSAEGASLTQQPTGGPEQVWTLDERADAPKKGNGGFPQMADAFTPTWAYNWGPTDTYPAEVDFWPMQWGSFNWGTRPSLVPEWQRNGEPIVLMGYNEPDKVDQSNISVATAADMWPRLEVMDMPLLGPAVAGHPAFDPWIQDFMALADEREMRIEYAGVHTYGGPNADWFITRITDAYNQWGLDIVVSEFSTVDWNNNNGWNNDDVFNFFAEVLWRMEELPYVHRYAVFVFTDDPANPISDNRGEMLNADGTLTPEGRLYSAWDGDTQIRTDTPYHLHNEASHARIGAVPGQQGLASITLGDREDHEQPFRWRAVPGPEAALFSLVSAADGRRLAYTARGLELVDPAAPEGITGFRFVEIEHGWFAIEEPTLNRRLRSNASQGGALSLANAGSTASDVRWRFAPVFEAPPGPPRDGTAESIGGGEVLLTWAPHGFRDLLGITVYRQGPGDPQPVAVAAGIADGPWIDSVPTPGTYTYSLSAVGDTGESDLAPIGAVAVETCPADFNADFAVDAADAEAAVIAIGSGLDYNGDGAANFFDVIGFLRVLDEGCPGGD